MAQPGRCRIVPAWTADLALAPLPFPWDSALLPLPLSEAFPVSVLGRLVDLLGGDKSTLGSSFCPVLASCGIFNFSPARAEPRVVMPGRAGLTSNTAALTGNQGCWRERQLALLSDPGSVAMGWSLLLLWLLAQFLCPLSPFVSSPPSLALPSRAPWVGSSVGQE